MIKLKKIKAIKYTFCIYYILLFIDHFFIRELGFFTSPSFLFLPFLLFLLISSNTVLIKNINKIIYLWMIFFLFVGMSLLSFSFSVNALQGYFSNLSYLLILLVTQWSISSFQLNTSKLILIIAMLLAVLGIYGFVNYYGEVGLYSYRLTYSLDYNPTHFAALLGVVLVALLYEMNETTNKIYKFLAINLSIILFSLLLFTQGRTALLGVGVASIYLLYKIIFNKSIINTAILIFSIAILVTVLQVSFSEQLKLVDLSRVEMLTDYDDPTRVTSGRSGRWEFYLSKPPSIFGYGYKSTSVNNIGAEGSPHNTYILVYYEYGVLMFLFLVLIIFYMYRYSISSKISQNNNITCALFLYMFTISFGNDMIYYKYFWIIVSLFILYSYKK